MKTVDKAIRSEIERSTGKINRIRTHATNGEIDKIHKHTETQTQTRDWDRIHHSELGFISFILHIYVYRYFNRAISTCTRSTHFALFFFIWPTFDGLKNKPYKITFNLFVYDSYDIYCQKIKRKNPLNKILIGLTYVRYRCLCFLFF